MFRYYALSDVCYVYLHDVDLTGDPSLGSWTVQFERSRWHQRGWTLQELLAPRNVQFMTKDWTRIGTKIFLADMLQQITGIPAAVLRFEQDVADMSVAARLSWAAGRRTTRVEDEAYCLFGLFGINMPTMYGEGRDAFYRLQEEIMRTSTDTSLLVWGECLRCATRERLETPFERAHSVQDTRPEPACHLLASSPAAFSGLGALKYLPRSGTPPRRGVSLSSHFYVLQTLVLTVMLVENPVSPYDMDPARHPCSPPCCRTQ